MRLCLVLLIALAACSNTLPDNVKNTPSSLQDAPYPTLTPVDGLFATAQDGSQIEAATADIQNRAARLNQKANALRGRTIIDGQDRIRRLNRS